MTKALLGGASTGANPTYRSKKGTKAEVDLLTSQIVFIGDPVTLKNAIFKDGKFIRFVTYVPDIKRYVLYKYGNSDYHIQKHNITSVYIKHFD